MLLPPMVDAEGGGMAGGTRRGTHMLPVSRGQAWCRPRTGSLWLWRRNWNMWVEITGLNVPSVFLLEPRPS